MAYFPLYARRKLAGVLTGVYWTPPALTYVGLFTNIPDDDTPGVYVVDAGLKVATWATQLDGTRTLSSQLVFGPAGDEWGEIQSVGVFDSSAGAPNLLYAEEVAPESVGIGDTYEIGIGELVVEIPV
jgi:hypothetical protein